jgi:superfamily II DNA or RNA helicase
LFDKEKVELVQDRWNPYTNLPIKDISEYCYTMRKVVNSDPSRIEAIKKLQTEHPKIIIFYNFNYELDILRELKDNLGFSLAEYNGHKHEPIPNTDKWIYLVQYTSGSEAWNCIETNCIVFYSMNYSYRTMTQSAGRIDRRNTKFKDLYYYTLKSSTSIDLSISKSLRNKEDFNEQKFLKGELK